MIKYTALIASSFLTAVCAAGAHADPFPCFNPNAGQGLQLEPGNPRVTILPRNPQLQCLDLAVSISIERLTNTTVRTIFTVRNNGPVDFISKPGLQRIEIIYRDGQGGIILDSYPFHRHAAGYEMGSRVVHSTTGGVFGEVRVVLDPEIRRDTLTSNDECVTQNNIARIEGATWPLI